MAWSHPIRYVTAARHTHAALTETEPRTLFGARRTERPPGWRRSRLPGNPAACSLDFRFAKTLRLIWHRVQQRRRKLKRENTYSVLELPQKSPTLCCVHLIMSRRFKLTCLGQKGSGELRKREPNRDRKAEKKREGEKFENRRCVPKREQCPRRGTPTEPCKLK